MQFSGNQTLPKSYPYRYNILPIPRFASSLEKKCFLAETTAFSSLGKSPKEGQFQADFAHNRPLKASIFHWKPGLEPPEIFAIRKQGKACNLDE
jgi:hypothetical protein